MNRTPIASPLLLVGRDATETWHGSDDEYRELGISSGKQPLKRCAFVGTNPTDEPITSALPVIRPE